MRRSRVGYCGGVEPAPSYKAVCGDKAFAAYAEAVELDFDPAVLPFPALLDAFFRAHDALAAGRSRQYSSIIFAHGDEQKQAARAALAARPRACTIVEDGDALPFWDAEPYHQKWLLQRKRELFLSLGMESAGELLEPPATLLNAVAAGKLSTGEASIRMDEMLSRGDVGGAAHGRVLAMLDSIDAQW